MSDRKQLIILNTVAVASFVFCWIWLGFELSEEAMFTTSDSRSYLEVTKWMFFGDETISTSVRPVLYPTLMGIPYLVFGVIGVWILQFACWLLSVNLTFLSAKKWSNNRTVGWIAATIIILNLSFIALTFHALTEVVATALLSVLCYHVVSYSKRYNQAQFGFKLLLIFVLLTLIKPVFYYPTLLCLILIIFAYRKHYRLSPKKLLFPLLIIVPILLQMIFVQVKHGSFAVSTIAGVTFKNYYFAQCVRGIEKTEDEQSSIQFVNEMNSEERLNYMLDNKGVFVVQFAENLILNIKADPVFLESDFVKKSKTSYSFMQLYNLFSLLVIVIGTILLVLLFLFAFFKRNKEMWIPLFCIGGLSSYYLFTTGLSFWQGDRLVLTSIALWIPLYSVLFYQVGSKLALRFKK